METNKTQSFSGNATTPAPSEDTSLLVKEEWDKYIWVSIHLQTEKLQ
jgi:hypothetical protein